ncbi:MAG: tetratricopeptide repeat protein [Gammaproteobacteria bacterium]|nr:tetratricopeptide repeat protein [Gammaproteobacteria bacterium]
MPNLSRILVLISLLAFGALAMVPAPAEAQQSAPPAEKKKEKPKSTFMTERTYKRLTRIYDLLGESKYAEVVERLRSLEPLVKKNPYELAVVTQIYGFVYAAQSQYPKALEYMERAYRLDALPEEPTKQLVYNMAQLNMAIKRFRKGIKILEEWFATAEKPSAEAYALAGVGWANLNDYGKAIPYLKKAIAIAETPQEDWFKLLLAMHYERSEFKQAAGVLEKMVRFWPQEERYWQQLSGIRLRLEEDDKALAVLELAYKQDLLEKSEDWVRLAMLYLHREVPAKAGAVLEKGIRDGIVESDQKNWELLGNAWTAAQEKEKAIEALSKAATMAGDGKLDLRVAYLYLQKEDWKNSAAALKRALQKGGLKDTGTAYIMLGMSAYETKAYDDAVNYFQKALEFEKSKEQAAQWIQHVESERAASADSS